ncbi:nuclear transport factor 2 family protein [Sphingomonas sp. RB56-2]|uniref:Nuclear transport factor 2 family protein n=1 Tax=Sphingomonas brevis TaxID=2908206 RepID=A0ABT0S612_9SPHN|nr:nuclear transport factor 2 family protein [Sphingomonas brevis]MCL6739832.1 nuclear transport factor 2 family protein [Sphingomonas brevis]
MKLASTLRTLAIGGTVCAFVLVTPALAADDPKVTAEITALARAQWASEIAGESAAQQMASAADDYTEFNGDYPTRIDGKAMATRMSEVAPYQKTVFADMQNAKVQTYGDTAILTYNYAGITRGADGKTQPTVAKSTRVYVKSGGQWKLVHANFAPVPAPAN